MELETFITRAQAYGVTVPGVEQWREARRLPSTLPDDDAPLLGRSPAEILAAAERAATIRMLNHPRIGSFADVVRGIQRRLDDEFIASLGNQVDSMILELREPFDVAARAARHVIDLGVSPEADLQSLFDAPEDQRRAWRDFTTNHVRALVEILHLRVFMSQLLGAPPHRQDSPILGERNPEVEWSVVITRPRKGGEVSHFPLDAASSHKPWLRIAQALYLPTTAEMDGTNVAAAEGLPVRDLIEIAKQRIRDGHGVDPEEAQNLDLVNAHEINLA